MKRFRNIITVLIAFIGTYAFAGISPNWTEIDKGIMSKDLAALDKKFQGMTHYSVTMTDATYKDYSTNTYHEQSSGYFIRAGQKFHNYIMGIHTIQDSLKRVVIDSNKGIFIVADPTTSLNISFTASDYEALLKVCLNIKKSVVGNYTYYRMEFAEGMPYTAYELTLKDGLPEKIVMYYSKKVKVDNVMTQPRVEIAFGNWVTDKTYKGNPFDIQRYLDSKGSEYILKSPYSKKFKLLDQRVLTKIAKK